MAVGADFRPAKGKIHRASRAEGLAEATAQAPFSLNQEFGPRRGQGLIHWFSRIAGPDRRRNAGRYGEAAWARRSGRT